MRILTAGTIIALCFLCGCSQKAGKVAFFEVVKSHKELTIETNNSVISSIEDDLTNRDDLSLDAHKAVQNLLERLRFINKQSEVIYNYVVQDEVDSNLLSELVKNRWTKPAQ